MIGLSHLVWMHTMTQFPAPAFLITPACITIKVLVSVLWLFPFLQSPVFADHQNELCCAIQGALIWRHAVYYYAIPWYKIFFQVEVFQLYHLKAWAMISTMSYHVQMQTIMILDLVPPMLITSAHMTPEVLYLFQSWNCFSFCTSCLA